MNSILAILIILMVGSRAMFTTVDWRGDDSQISVPKDSRNGLSWRGRFAGIQNAVNCYSPTEDVLTNPTTNKVFGVESSNFGGAWSKQELFKGCALWYGVNAVTFSGMEIEGGLEINAAGRRK